MDIYLGSQEDSLTGPRGHKALVGSPKTTTRVGTDPQRIRVWTGNCRAQCSTWAGTPRAHEPTASARLAHSFAWAPCSFIPVSEQTRSVRTGVSAPNRPDGDLTSPGQAASATRRPRSRRFSTALMTTPLRGVWGSPSWKEDLVWLAEPSPRPLSVPWGLGLPRLQGVRAREAWRVGMGNGD